MRRPDQPLHLLEVGVRWPPETFVALKLRKLAARGMRITVASTSVFDEEAELPGVDLLAISPRSRVGKPRPLELVRTALPLLVRSPRRLFKLARGVRAVPERFRRRYDGAGGLFVLCAPLARLRPDLVHFEWQGTAVRYEPLFDVWGCPVVTSCWGSDTAVHPHVPGREAYATRLPGVLRRVSAVHCVSESTKRDALALGLDPSKATIIRPSVDPEVFAPATGNGEVSTRAGKGPLRVVMVGWLRWEKGHEYALEAIRRVVDAGVAVRLEIVGGVPGEFAGRLGGREWVLHTIADLGLEPHVHLAGHLSPAEVSARLQASDVFLHASVTEGFPTAMMEAMACGLPVVTAAAGGVRELVTDGTEGFVVPTRDPERLAEALVRLSREPDLRARMGQAGRRRFLSELTLEHQDRAWLAMYHEVAGA